MAETVDYETPALPGVPRRPLVELLLLAGPTIAQMLRFQLVARELLDDVRIIPQTHKMLGAL